MSEILKVLNKKSVELKSEKVELSSIAMIEAILKDAKKIFKDGEKFSSEMTTLQKKAKVLNANATAMINGGSSELKEFEKQAKELGVNVSNLKQFKELRDVIGALDTVKLQTAKFK